MNVADQLWSLDELPETLAALTCKHVLDEGAQPGFVDYRGGHLTVLCCEERHEMDNSPDAYGMVHLAHLLSDFGDLSDVSLSGGYSNAVRSDDGSWITRGVSKENFWEKLKNLVLDIRAKIASGI